MSIIDNAYSYAVKQCNNPKVGYSQSYRCEQIVNGITYYDCASFIWYALKHAGFDIEKAHGNTYPFVVHTMHNTLIKLGFKQVPVKSNWRAGDILTRVGHTEMVYKDRVTMGAHSNDRPLEKQVSINSYSTNPSLWTNCYRYKGGASSYADSLKWVYGNRYLTRDETVNNSKIVYSYLRRKGWSENAICGILGNMFRESGVNPALWQSMDYGNLSMGYGLVQWTPASKYLNWAKSKGYDNRDGFKQLDWIDILSQSSGQWISTGAYPESFEQFKKSTKDVDYLTRCFLKNFERAGIEAIDDRLEYAHYCKGHFDEVYGFVDSENPWNFKKKRKKYKFYLFNKKGILK